MGFTQKNICIYHFTSPTNDRIIKYWDSINKLKATLCFDLEDVVKELDNSSENSVYRHEHRENVINTIDILTKVSKLPNIGIRINQFDSKEFHDDLYALTEIKDKIKFSCIFLPKVSCKNEIINCCKKLKSSQIHFLEIIPIIENIRCYNSLESILSLSGGIINKIAFGHCDFNYDQKCFPFFHQDSLQYWEWINYITDNTEKYKIMFINSPYLNFNDDITLLYMLNRLVQKTLCKAGQITMTLRQAKLCSEYMENDYNCPEMILKRIDKRGKEDYAKSIINDFIKYKFRNKSFSLNEKRIYISPQEYLTALKYLKALEIIDV